MIYVYQIRTNSPTIPAMRPSISSTRKGSVSNVATLFTTYSLYISTIALASRELTFRIIFIPLKQSDPGKNISLPGPDLSSNKITNFSAFYSDNALITSWFALRTSASLILITLRS